MKTIEARRAASIPPTHRQPVIMFIEDPGPPAWALDWCRRGGVEPRIRQTSTRPRFGSPTGLLTAVTGLAGRPVLVLRPSTSRFAPVTVTAAIGDLPKDAPVLAAAVDASAAFGARLVLVHGVPRSFAERSVGLESALDHGRWLLDTAARRVADQVPGVVVERRLVRMRPDELVSPGPGGINPAGLLVLGMPTPRWDGGCGGLVVSSALHYWPDAILFVPTQRLGTREEQHSG